MLRKLLIISLYFIFPISLCAQNFGDLDLSFDPGTGANDIVFSIAIQPDGKILIGGKFTEYNGIPILRIARLHPDGSLDYSFNPSSGPNGAVIKIKVLSNSKILISGDFTTYRDIPRHRIAMLHSNGSLDTSFKPQTNLPNIVFRNIETFEVLKSSKILVGGRLYNWNGCILRLLEDGRIDSSFKSGKGFMHNQVTPIVTTITELDDNKILVGGKFNSYNDSSAINIARLYSNGFIDTTFRIESMYNELSTLPSAIIYHITKHKSGYIAVGRFDSINNIYCRNIAKLDEYGNVDSVISFNAMKDFDIMDPRTAYVLENNRIMFGGRFKGLETNWHGILKTLKNGEHDISFPFSRLGASVLRFVEYPENKFFAIGGFTTYIDSTITRINRIARFHGCFDTYDTIHVTNCSKYTMPSGNLTVYESGEYRDTLENYQGCDSILTIHLQLFSPTNASFTLISDTICKNAPPFKLSGGTPEGGEYFGKGITSQRLYPSVMNSGINSIKYVYTDSNGCKDTVEKYIYITNENHCDYSPLIYPNPTNAIVIVDFDKVPHSIHEIKIIDMRGGFINTLKGNQKIEPIQKDLKYQFSMKDYSSGLYLLRIITDKKVYQHKIIFLDVE